MGIYVLFLDPLINVLACKKAKKQKSFLTNLALQRVFKKSLSKLTFCGERVKKSCSERRSHFMTRD